MVAEFVDSGKIFFLKFPLDDISCSSWYRVFLFGNSSQILSRRSLDEFASIKLVLNGRCRWYSSNCLKSVNLAELFFGKTGMLDDVVNHLIPCGSINITYAEELVSPISERINSYIICVLCDLELDETNKDDVITLLKGHADKRTSSDSGNSCSTSLSLISLSIHRRTRNKDVTILQECVLAFRGFVSSRSVINELELVVDTVVILRELRGIVSMSRIIGTP